MKVLITSVGLDVAVNLIRYFKKAGDTVIGADINPYGYTAGSVLADEYEQTTFALAPDYIDKMASLIERKGIDIFIPVNDLDVYQVSKNIDRIPCKCIVPPVNVIAMVRDKLVCSKKIHELGLNVPDFLGKDDDTNRVLRDRISAGSKGIKYFSKGAMVPVYDPEISFLQRDIKGQEYTVDVLADEDGKPYYIVRRIRLKVRSGTATKVQIENDESLISDVRKLLENIKLPGFSNIQFIKDEKGVNWFIEINYRFSGGGATTLAVCPEVLEAFKAICKGRKPIQEFNEGVKWGSVVARYYEETVYSR